MQQPTEPNLVAIICQYAKDENETGLHQIWKQTSIDCSYGRYNAMYLLAKEGTPYSVRALDYLHKKWGANVNWAIMGAAAAGNYGLIRKLLADGAMVNYAMYGAGHRGDRELIDWLKARGGDVFWAVTGAAGSTNRELYDELNKEAEAKDKSRIPSGGTFLLGASLVDNPTLFKQLVESEASAGALIVNSIVAAAQANNKGSLKQLLETPLDENFGKKADWLIMGAYAGHHDGLMREYMKRKTQVGWAAQGAGYGGHLDLIEYLLRKAPDKSKVILNFAAQYAARKGDTHLVIKLLAKAGISDPPFSLDEDYILAAAEEGQIAVLNACDIDKLSEKRSKPQPELRADIIKALMTQGFINGNEDDVLRVASFINDPKLRELFIAEAHKINNKLEPKYLNRKSFLLNKFMKDFDLNYNQALAWNSPELRTWLVDRAGRYPNEIVQHVASYVVRLTGAEAADLAVKLSEASQKYTQAVRSKAAFKFSEPAEKAAKEEPPEQKKEGPKP